LVREFERYMTPAALWKPFENSGLIWGFRRTPAIRRFLRTAYRHTFPILSVFFRGSGEKRLLEKTASNCFRLGYVNEVFPDARIIYPLRDGRNNVNSLINAWLQPNRFFTYDVPAELNIKDYPDKRWKFVLPPGWREYTQRSLAEVCAFQWRACHEAMLGEIGKPKYQGRVFQLPLERLVKEPERTLRELAAFIDLPYDDYLSKVARELPVVNSPDNDVSPDKWRVQNRERIEQILPTIEPTMRRLGYEP